MAREVAGVGDPIIGGRGAVVGTNAQVADQADHRFLRGEGRSDRLFQLEFVRWDQFEVEPKGVPEVSENVFVRLAIRCDRDSKAFVCYLERQDVVVPQVLLAEGV